jgi:hypothetical protein
MSDGTLTRRFWQGLPPGPFAAFLAAVFFTFGAFGFLLDVLSGGQLPVGELAFLVVFCGTVAVGLAWSLTKQPLLLPVVLVVQAVGVGLTQPNEMTGGRLSFDAIGGILFLVVGYIFFIGFITGEGAKAMRLQTEMRLAREIHETLAPPVSLTNEACEVAGRSVPTSEVGGDLVDAVGPEGCALCYVIDVSGHGVPAGSLMGMIKSAARMKLLSSTALGSLLTDLNRVVFDVKRSSMFATAACLIVRSPRQAAYSLAGHLPVLHYRAATGALEMLSDGQTALGIIDSQAFTETPVAVGPGDVLAIVTDGLTEVADGKGGELGLEAIARTLAEHAALPLESILDRLFERARRHGVQFDDQTALLVRIR